MSTIGASTQSTTRASTLSSVRSMSNNSSVGVTGSQALSGCRVTVHDWRPSRVRARLRAQSREGFGVVPTVSCTRPTRGHDARGASLCLCASIAVCVHLLLSVSRCMWCVPARVCTCLTPCVCLTVFVCLTVCVSHSVCV